MVQPVGSPIRLWPKEVTSSIQSGPLPTPKRYTLGIYMIMGEDGVQHRHYPPGLIFDTSARTRSILSAGAAGETHCSQPPCMKAPLIVNSATKASARSAGDVASQRTIVDDDYATFIVNPSTHAIGGHVVNDGTLDYSQLALKIGNATGSVEALVPGDG